MTFLTLKLMMMKLLKLNFNTDEIAANEVCVCVWVGLSNDLFVHNAN